MRDFGSGTDSCQETEVAHALLPVSWDLVLAAGAHPVRERE